jgi:histidinol dehydrogenase
MSTYAPIIEWNTTDANATVEEFLKRPPIERKADDSARAVLADIRVNGDAAVLKYAAQFDNTTLTPETLRVTPEEIVAAEKEVDEEFKKAAHEAHKRIVRYGEAGMHEDWKIDTPRGGMLGERWIPVPRVGAYIPGGAAPLASTSLHTVTLAKVAGVPEIVACTPCKDGVVNPYVLYSLNLAGATEIYKIGGIQSIGAMAYGTETIKKVCKIVGPGGPYVTAAKRLVYGDVSLDMVAGPSEIAVLCDHTANPAHVAADLLSQAEHGSGSEKTLLVTTSLEVAKAAQIEVVKQAHERNRTEAILKVLEHGTLITVVPDLEAGIELCNRFAPEHMELIVENPEPWAEKVLYAGALFIGPYTPEPVGDFVAGPSHVLPTGGTATFFSGLTVDDFRRRMSLVQFTKEDLEETVHVTNAFGRVETLDAHARSANIRLD